MCGISGGYNITKEAARDMLAATAHRGPDATGITSLGPVTFGHNRLAIIDISAASNQPMLSKDGRHMLVFNGEIYNFKQLRDQLPNWKFVSRGDSEVLLAALVTWGEKALERLEGIFSFAWYDHGRDSILLARDHMGVKPLYYSLSNSALFFSSELAGLIAGSEQRTLDRGALSHFLSLNYVPSPHSLVSGVSKVRPGHMVRYTKGALVVERYFTLTAPVKKTVPHDEIVKTIGREVQAQLMSDRPVGIFLSGGIDSSIVLHHAAQSIKARTFSTYFEMVAGGESEAAKFNIDAELAAKTAAAYGSDHTAFPISLADIRSELLPILGQLDEPVANPTEVTQFFLSRYVREQGVVVALGGDGGDELWAGYIRHAVFRAAMYAQKFPRLFQQLGVSVYPRLSKLLDPLGAPIHSNLMAFPHQAVNRLLRGKVLSESAQSFFSKRYCEAEVAELSWLERFMRVDRETWLADEALHRSDRTSMAAGVELRVPHLGLPVVMLADSVHSQGKFTLRQKKKLLRDAYRSHLPAHLLDQPKRGWLSPGAKWFRDKQIEAQVREVFSDTFYDGLSDLIDWPSVQTMLSDHIEAKGYYLNPLWNLLALQIWAQKHKVKW